MSFYLISAKSDTGLHAIAKQDLELFWKHCNYITQYLAIFSSLMSMSVPVSLSIFLLFQASF